MSGGVGNFFASLSPETQQELIGAASQALGAQHRSIGKNTANASRIREYLATNDAYAMEQAARAGIKGAPQEPMSENGSGVSDFQRQNEAFMSLQGDDLVRTERAPAKSVKSAPAKSAPKSKGGRTYPLAEDAMTADQSKNTYPVADAMADHVDAKDATLPQEEAAPNSGEADSSSDPWWLAALGLSRIATGSKGVATDGGRSVPALQSEQKAATGKEVSTQVRSAPDDIVDAEWTDAKDLPAPQEQKQLTGPRKQIEAQSQQRALPLPESFDEFDDVQKLLAGVMGRSEPPSRAVDLNPRSAHMSNPAAPDAKQSAAHPSDSHVTARDDNYNDIMKKLDDVMSERGITAPKATKAKAPKTKVR